MLILPSPAEIVAMVTAVAQAMIEIMRAAQTDAGQAHLKRMLEDRAAWDQFWRAAPGAVGKFFRGGWWNQ